MNIHVVWAQGWEVAPPKATRNAEAWCAVGDVQRWSVRTAVEAGLVPSSILEKARFPAMQADIILASAMSKIGGMAIGADMIPLEIESLKNSLREAEKAGMGQVIYQSMRDEPYSGASYFPAGNRWIELVCKQQLINLAELGHSQRISVVTGPRMWRILMKKHPEIWFSSVRTIPAWIAFTHEPKTRGSYRDAWLNPGLTADWMGLHPERWQ